ncbi:MAG: AraC family transcriptional regulator [Sphaerochaeta sp.]|jgi:AraC-like DNA-binding protein|nr:AraC family transcriptional regulator [Sphaerochaeta sp.]
MDQDNVLTKDSRFVGLDEVRKSAIDISLSYCGIQQCTPLHNNGPQVRTTGFIHIVLSGKGILKMNDTIYHLTQEDAFFIPSGVRAQYTADKDDPWRYMWVGFSGLMANESLSKAGFSQKYPVRKIASDLDIFRKDIEGMIDAYQLTYANELRRNGYFFHFLADLIDDYHQQDPSSVLYDYQASVYARQAYDYIMRNFSTHIEIGDLANSMGVSRNYLSLCFKKMYHVSPKQFLNATRIEHATSMLVSQNLHITEIARKVGFDDPLAFSKLFKKYHHMSPSEFRDNPPHFNKDKDTPYCGG